MQSPNGTRPSNDARAADYDADLPASRRGLCPEGASCSVPETSPCEAASGLARETCETCETPETRGARGVKPVSVVVAGLGGQGVLRAAQVLAKAAFLAGHDVKTSEVHGMSQRGGSVYSDVRFGERVDSPMVPAGEADYFLSISADQVEPHRWLLGKETLVITPDRIDAAALENRRSLNVALIGALSACLAIDEGHFVQAIRENFPADKCDPNLQAFALGRRSHRGDARKGTSHG